MQNRLPEFESTIPKPVYGERDRDSFMYGLLWFVPFLLTSIGASIAFQVNGVFLTDSGASWSWLAFGLVLVATVSAHIIYGGDPDAQVTAEYKMRLERERDTWRVTTFIPAVQEMYGMTLTLGQVDRLLGNENWLGREVSTPRGIVTYGDGRLYLEKPVLKEAMKTLKEETYDDHA